MRRLGARTWRRLACAFLVFAGEDERLLLVGEDGTLEARAPRAAA
ncbi:hypothetical protein [Streptomyces sp. gb1(2016)]|nr:hypothetical protein [Streptomyces sp. gb1(2016)]